MKFMLDSSSGKKYTPEGFKVKEVKAESGRTYQVITVTSLKQLLTLGKIVIEHNEGMPWESVAPYTIEIYDDWRE